jgi:hypothetical protein
MKNYLKLSSLSTAIGRIIPSCACKSTGKKTQKEGAFVVLNSDNDYGFYVKRLAREVEALGLSEIPKILRRTSLKNIETGNLIVFGDATGSVDYDFRVEADAHNLDHLDGRRFKAYDIINDFDKIIKRLKTYSSVNEDEVDYVVVEERKAPKCKTIDVVINANVYAKRPKYQVNIAVLRPKLSEQKVTVFDNWVKVGYNQYDIYCNLFGDKFIYVEGVKFFIHKDRYGNEYLTK